MNEKDDSATKDPEATTKSLAGESYTLTPSLVVNGDPSTSFVSRFATKVKKMFFSAVSATTMGLIVTPVALLMPRKVHEGMISKFIPRVMDKLALIFRRERDVLLRNVSGKVLDVGAGGGAYFTFYKNATEIVAIEPLENLHTTLNEKVKMLSLRGRFSIHTDFLETYVANHPEEAGTFDWIILGNVLCEVPDIPDALKACDKLLKKGLGKIYFCEHVARPRGTFMRNFQMLINPWWVRVSLGCNCNRDTLQHIRSMPNWETISWTYDMFGGQPWNGPFVLGLARKK